MARSPCLWTTLWRTLCRTSLHRWRTRQQAVDQPVDKTVDAAGDSGPDLHNAIPRGVDENPCQESSSARVRDPPRVDAVAEAYDGGPVAALRRIGFLLERGREDTYKVKAFRGAAAAILPLSDDEVRAAVEDGTLTKLAGVGASSAKVIAAAVRGEVPERLAAAREGARRPADQGRPRAARPAPRRPALALGLVRRRLADRGDGVHRDRARPRVPGAHRPLAPAPRRQRAERRAAEQAARRRRRGQRAPRRGRRLHAAQGHRGRHPRRRQPRPDRGDARPARRPGRQRALQAGDGRAGHDQADGRPPSGTRAPTCSATAPAGW